MAVEDTMSIVGERFGVFGRLVDAVWSGKITYEEARTRTERDPIVTLFCRSLFHWIRFGCPSLVPSHKLTASFMATAISAEVEEHIALPWPIFAVRIPENVLPTDWKWGLFVDLGALNFGGVEIIDGRYMFFTVSNDDVMVRRAAATLTDLCELLVPNGEEGTAEKLLTIEYRCLQLCCRTVIGCALELSPRVEEIARGGGGKKKRQSDEPTSWTFQLNRPVNVDMRSWVAATATGTGSIMSKQHMVKGHWKRQACGSQAAHRKWIQIEPYWRGPEDAPIIVREHRMGRS